MANTKHTFALHLEWLDPASEMKRPFKLLVHVRMDNKNEIEIVCCPGLLKFRLTLSDEFELQYDTKNRKTFLKRILYPDIEIEDLFIGAKLNMYVAWIYL